MVAALQAEGGEAVLVLALGHEAGGQHGRAGGPPGGVRVHERLQHLVERTRERRQQRQLPIPQLLVLVALCSHTQHMTQPRQARHPDSLDTVHSESVPSRGVVGQPCEGIHLAPKGTWNFTHSFTLLN